MPSIFVSYRREDSEGEAGHLSETLVNRYGRDAVFFDVEAIKKGEDFRVAIKEAVRRCDVLLAIIGRNWVDVRDQTGNRRLDSPDDFVRLEIAAALQRTTPLPVIPVLVHGAKMPRPDQLPEDLEGLAYRNGIELAHARWRSDVELLIQVLDPHMRHHKPIPPPKPWWRSRLAVLSLVLAGALVSVVAYLRYAHPSPLVRVPELSGLSQRDAESQIKLYKLSVGRVFQIPMPDVPQDTVVHASSPAGDRVRPGTAINLDVATTAADPRPQAATPEARANPGKVSASVPKETDAKNLPNFAGTWTVFENVIDGVAHPFSLPTPLTITQEGNVVHMGNRDLEIRPDGSISYQTFAAGDNKSGHSVPTADQADLVDTFTWKIEGSTLVFETLFDYRHPYFGTPVGKQLRVWHYRR